MTQGGDVAAGWEAFLAELEAEILPLYAEHERAFDPRGIHGRPHIGRAVLFAEYMARTYARQGVRGLDLYAIRMATAFHDCGRQGNGTDIWESDSAALCAGHVRRSRPAAGEAYARYVGGLIEKWERPDLAWEVVYDADVLEIMRLCGLGGFRCAELRFTRSSVQGLKGERGRALVREAARWIAHTERLKDRLAAAPHYMAALLAELERERARFPLLATLL